MNRRIAMVIVPLLAVALYFSGCVGEIGDVPEAQTPTGCHKSEGRYYDPHVGKCLQAASPYEARRLNTYRYVNQLVEDGEVERAPFAIEFFKYLPIDKAESLWVELHEQGATMLVFGGNFPTNQSYDGVGKENVREELEGQSKRWGEWPYVGCGWHSGLEKPIESPTATLEEMLIKSVETMEEDDFLGPPRALPERRNAILEDKDCRISGMYVEASPRVILDFWNRHIDEVKAIQPHIDFLDKAQQGFGTEVTLEGE
ncbi:hypothetical protein KC725_04140 [Candidatus Peregrinibacteria bacterium]|nr:hypothetical protein [Candidatus Peregrinibacteria bacterium]